MAIVTRVLSTCNKKQYTARRMCAPNVSSLCIIDEHTDATAKTYTQNVSALLDGACLHASTDGEDIH